MSKKIVATTLVLCLIAGVALAVYFYTIYKDTPTGFDISMVEEWQVVDFEYDTLKLDLGGLQGAAIEPDTVQTASFVIENTCAVKMLGMIRIYEDSATSPNGGNLADYVLCDVELARENKIDGTDPSLYRIYSGTLSEMLETDLGWRATGADPTSFYPLRTVDDDSPAGYVPLMAKITLTFPKIFPEEYFGASWQGTIKVIMAEYDDQDLSNPYFDYPPAP